MVFPSPRRSSVPALSLPQLPELDAVVTDPPYYDNIPYADISDFFYVWLKRTIGAFYGEHFASDLTPKKSEATALSGRFAGDVAKATSTYELMMKDAFKQAADALRADGTSVGAGLRAFTKYDRVEYANGEEVPAEKFLAEVEGVVLDAMMGKLFGQSGSTISAIDPASRFYVLWRFIYKAAEIDAGEAIVFTHGLHVELDGQSGLSGGKDALVEKAKYRARDFSERGDNAKLGLPGDDGAPPPLIDVLHRLVWLMENSPRKIGEFLAEAQPDRERMRVLAQALAGAALKGKSEADAARLISTTPAEQAALAKLLANWRSLVEHAAVPKEERADLKAGQKRLELE